MVQSSAFLVPGTGWFVHQFEVVIVVTDGNDCGYYSEENIKSALGTKLTQLTSEN